MSSIGLSRVTQVWSAALADLQPAVPSDKLDVLLRVCAGAESAPPEDGDLLRRALPLSKFLEKSEGKDAEQVVPKLVQILHELPGVWTARQNGPLQAQADFTQLMMDLRWAMRCPTMPSAAQQQLSTAVEQLLQALFTEAAHQPLEQHSSWIKTGCNLLLRALTRSPQFVEDPMLPLLPGDAFALLTWLNDTALGTRAADAASSSGSSGAAAGTASNGRSSGRVDVAAADTSEGQAPAPAPAAMVDPFAAVAGNSCGASTEMQLETASRQPAGKLLLKDDKVYLLLTKIVMTATGLSSESASMAAAAAQAAAAAGSSSKSVAAAANGTAAKAAVGWADGTVTANGGPGGNGSTYTVNPGLLVQLLEWSSTKVELAMQQLLEPSGSSSDAAPSREATTACVQLAAVLIHTLQAGPPLPAELESRLMTQVERLLETALAVGEAAVSSAAAAQERDADSDKVLALGARVLASMIPFVAAAVLRGSLEQQLELTSRVQQLMLAAAWLATRHGVIAGPAGPAASHAGAAAAAAPVAVGGALGRIAEDPSSHPTQYHHLHRRSHASPAAGPAGATRAATGMGSKFRAGMNRLTARRAPRNAFGSGFKARLSPRSYQQQWLTRPGSRRAVSYCGNGLDAGLGGEQRLGAGDEGWGLTEDLQLQLLVAEADPVLSAEDLAHPWSWDVTQPLTLLSEGVKLSQLPLSCGIGGFLLARAAAELLCEALAASWAAGSAAPVRCLMLLPQGSNSCTSAQVVTVLALGRLYVQSQADPVLGKLLLPLLADVLSPTASRSSVSSSHHTFGSAGGAAGALALAAGTRSADGGSGGVLNGLGVCGRGAGLTAEVAGAVVCALEGMASACVQHYKDIWLYDQALQLLLLMYQEPTPLSLQLLAGRSANPATAGLLADALHLLALGMEEAPQRARQDLRLKLLLLYSDVGARVGGGGAGSVAAADLGNLLAAVAVAAEGLQPGTLRLLGRSSSSRMSMHDIQSAQREDASTTRLFRNLWLYTAMHKLVNPAAATAAALPGDDGSSAGGAGVAAAGGGLGKGGLAGGVNVEWQGAAGRLAAVTPLLVVGTDSYHEADMVERLKVELGEQLSQAGSLGSGSSLSAVLTSLLGGKAALHSMAGPAGQVVGTAAALPHPDEAVLLAFTVAVALAELSRAALAPLPDLDDDPVVACPISVTLGYLKGVLPDGVAAAWTGAIVRRAVQLYINRLLALAARQEQQEEVAGIAGAGDPAAPPAPALAYAEQLACALIASLGGGPGPAAAAAPQDSLAPSVASLADELLEKLLQAFPALYHSQACYSGLLVQLQQEEGDVPLGQIKSSHHGLVWDRTKAWVQAAAEVAPMTTEALLHSFLTSSDSLPGAAPPVWLANGPALGLSDAGSGALTDSFDDFEAGAAPSADPSVRLDGLGGVGKAGVATQAAFRRAADLLQVCGAARRTQQLGQISDGAYEGALGLTRKLHYTGYVQGLMRGRGSAAAAAAMLANTAMDRGQPDCSSSSAHHGTAAASTSGRLAGGTSLETLRSVGEDKEVSAQPAQRMQLANGRLAADGSSLASDSEASEQTQMAVAEEIANQLEVSLQQPCRSPSRLAVAQLSATALLAVQPDAFSCSQLGMRLLGALVAAPLRHLTPETMRLSQFCWCWVSVESPEVLVPLISSLGSAWVWTLDQRMGLFSGGQQQQPGAAAASSSAGAHGEEAAGAAGGHVVEAEDDSSEVVHDPGMLQAISAHFLWLSYLLETWAVVSRFRDGRAAAARAVYGRLLAASLQDPSVLSHHPAAVGAYFRLLTLGLVFGRSSLGLVGAAGGGKGQMAGRDVLLLFDRILRAALLWFRSPPRYFAGCTRQTAAEQVTALEAFIFEVNRVLGAGWYRWQATQGWPSYDVAQATAAASGGGSAAAAAPAVPHPVWGVAEPAVSGYIQLLQLLCGEELARLRVWTEPLKHGDAAKTTTAVPWKEYVPLAWQVDPCLALGLLDHYPATGQLRTALEAMVVKHATDPQVQALPKAALLLATATKAPGRQDLLRHLAVWAPGNAAQGLQLLSGPAAADPPVQSYAIKCLFNERPEKLVFFLPQLVQLLRGDTDGAIRRFFLTAASHSDLFAHQLIWALNSEAKPPEEAFNPEVKRSGWQPPKDTGLWEISAQVKANIEAQMTPEQRQYWQAEGGYFEQVTALSGYLYKFPKDERRTKLQEALAQFQPPRQDLYLPTNPEARVKGHIPSSGACMQSAAKVPILVAFDVVVPAPGTAPGVGPEVPAKMACIFKVGDDIRQDVLAIQVIRLLHNAFKAAGLGLYLRPYGCLPTGYECGIIEVVPNTKSRAALGELSDRGLHDIFSAVFGAPGSAAFERARENFIVSEAAYAVASYLLQAKDRHNGNIMLDDEGHIVHIDFGFILEISPGGNMGFESAAFKLSHEMTQVLDPGGRRVSPQLALFEELVVRAYLAARTVAEPIIATVSLMAESGLPCFSRGAPVANLRQRFHLEMNDAQAAAFMRSQIADAYDKWTTGFYDYIQSLQNKIPY